MEEKVFYDVGELKEKAGSFGARIRMIIGQRSNGKTYQVVKEILDDFKATGHVGLYVRRWRDDLNSTIVADLFAEQEPRIKYRNHTYTLDGKMVCKAVALTQSEHFRGSVLKGNCKTVFFDEIFPEGCELPREFSRWESILSTAVRHYNDVNVYMVGNTLRRTSTYFTHYGIKQSRLHKGDIHLITAKGKTPGEDVKIALEWCKKNNYVTKNHNVYFVDTSAKNMISDGDFEAAPHHVGECQGVSLLKWDNAKKLPICFEHDDTFLEFRVFKGTLLVRPGSPARYVFSKLFRLNSRDRVYFDEFPLRSQSPTIDAMQKFLYDSISSNRFACDDIETGEIVQEMLGVKKL